MELLLLRHAQPEWSRAREAQVDPGLTSLGRRQAEMAADRLAGIHLDEVLVSTATRARQTAAPLLDRLPDLTTASRSWLHEIRQPDAWQGTPSEEVEKVFREARSRPRDAWWEGIEGGETFRDFHARVTDGLTLELAQRGIERDEDKLWKVPGDAPQRLLMVAHAGTNSVVLGHLLGLEPEPWEWERFSSNHASVTVLRSTPIAGQWIFSLQSFSDVEHLRPDLVTA
jgi:broad specificity phosphatase PhoE